ncbi:hypothetical protein Tco_1022487 [Tanacetum coccineum]
MVVQTQPQPPTITPTPTTPTPTTSTPTTSTSTPTSNQPTTLVHPSQPQKQRVRKPTRRDTEVTQPSEPDMVDDEDVLIEILILEETKNSQAAEILSLKLISSDDEAVLGDQEDASQQGRKIADIDKDADITLVDGV